MTFFNQEVELIIPPKKQNNKNNNVKVKTLNGYDAIRDKLDEHNTFTSKQTVEQTTKPKQQISIGL